ncbi:MAG: replication-associated recombination protein A, partial [Fusobacteriaceae bacterium]
KTILFLDEIHRFNKLQQDSLLSSTESGVIILIGATTENPYYNLNNALLSRVLLFEFKPLTNENIREIIKRGLKYLGHNDSKESEQDIINIIADISKGDSRIALNYLDLYHSVGQELSKEELMGIFAERRASYHKEEDKYNLISAMIKSVRGSDPDAGLYWMARLLAGGEDPKFIARRLMILASEDIGMANPEALLVANAAITATERIGMPEVRIILGQTLIYLAISTKSNSSYNGINKALEDVAAGDLEIVPSHIDSQARNYKYPHDYDGNFIEQVYSTKKRNYYLPGDNKNEKLICERLEKLWKERYK